MLNRTKIVTRMYTGFALILLGVLCLGFIANRSIRSLAADTSDIFEHPFTVVLATVEVRSDVQTAQRIMTSLVHAAAANEIDSLQKGLEGQRAKVDINMAVVRERYLGPREDVDNIDQALKAWRAARDETVALARNGKRTEAIALNGGRDALLGDAVLNNADKVLKFASNKAGSFKLRSAQESAAAVQLITWLFILILAGGLVVTVVITRSVLRSLRNAGEEAQKLIEGSGEKLRVVEAIAAGDLSREIVVTEPLKIELARLPEDDLGALLRSAVRLSEVQSALDLAMRQMSVSLRMARDAEKAADWKKSGLNELNALMRGEQSSEQVADRALGFLARYLKAGVGAMYLFDPTSDQLNLVASYACARREDLDDRIPLGKGLIGQAAREQKMICLSNVPSDFPVISSALGERAPQSVIAVPLVHDRNLVGAFELGTFGGFGAVESEFLESACEGMAIGLSVSLSRQQTAALLEQTQQQAEELRVQQEELQQTNEELEERAQMLEQQRESIRAKNHEIEAASQSLRQKAEELARTSAYKSEFLANMSHELRTPLNSLLILSKLLMENKDGNLGAKQVEFAATINSAGVDLLNLINDILDLSKVEAGQLQFQYTDLSPAELCASARALFESQAEQRGLAFDVAIDPGVPDRFQGDEQRIHQVLKNLLSNAFKFTERGAVALRLYSPSAAENPLSVAALAFSVSDTGTGIPADKQQMVFQAFKQADGSISRKYGGTGLGLSISLQLAQKMGGDLKLKSVEGNGSTFTLYLPLVNSERIASAERTAPAQQTAPATAIAAPAARNLPGGEPIAVVKAGLVPGQPSGRFEGRTPEEAQSNSILVIEDDPNFSGILQKMISERGFEVICAADGESGLALAERLLPGAILLDVMLPHIDGWGVMRRLKDNPRTRHIPVHFVSALEERQKAMAMGAIGYATKPVSMEQLNDIFQTMENSIARSLRRLLIVEDNTAEANSMVALLGEKDVDITVAATGSEAIGLLRSGSFDCMVLDLGLSDMSGFELLEQLQKMDAASRIPVVIHSGRDMSREDERKLRRFAESIIIKGAKSPERLLNEVSLFLHLVESKLQPGKQRMIRTAIDKEAMLEGKMVLLVDDDMRNVFSLSSVLAEKSMAVIEAENGIEALARLEQHPDVAIVLMDVMMPEMDGYTAMREIRRNPRFAALPIIAMTAKALKGDQEKCMAAGASDYISKPIDVDKLMSLIRVWTYQRN